MNINLSHAIPIATGYYLIKCEIDSKPHLVSIILNSSGVLQIINEFNKPIYFQQFPYQFWWSQVIVMDNISN